MTNYSAITFAPVQGFIAKSRKLRDLYGGSFILSYLARTICNAAKTNGYEIVSPATIQVTQGTPNQIILKRQEFIEEKEAEIYFKTAFDESWKALIQACREEIEQLLPNYRFSWDRNWNHWGIYAWEFFFAQGQENESITDVRNKLNEIKRGRDWIGINWIGESSTLSGIDEVAWSGMWTQNNPKTVSMGELDDKIKRFYGDLTNKLKHPIIDENEQLSIPELIKRFVTLSSIKDRLKAENVPQIDIPDNFADISRLKNKDNKEEKNRWTGWFQGDGDKIGDYLKSLVDKGEKTEEKALNEFSTALIKWGTILPLKLPSALDKTQVDNNKDGRIIYAGGDDFLGVIYRNYEPELTGKECLEWFAKFPDIWQQHEQEITVSVGFVWAGPGVPQRDVLEHCREAESAAKNYGRDRLAIRILFNSGNYLQWVAPWWCLEPILNAEIDWVKFYKDVATLENRHAFEGQKDVAIALFEIHVQKPLEKLLKESLEDRLKELNLRDETNWFNDENTKKTGILGERKNLDQTDINKGINNWVINLAKIGFHLLS
jgi:CRISPR-associated protein Cmr2